MSKVTHPPALLLRLILATLLFLQLYGCTGEQDNLALGTLERDRIALTATAAEIITALPVAEGATVKPGELLVQLDSRTQQARVLQARANVAKASANLEKLRNGARPEEVAAAQARLEGAQATLVDANKTFSRTNVLVKKKLLGQADLDSARARRDSAKAQVRDAKEQLLTLTNGTRPEDLEQGVAELAAAKAALTVEQRNLSELSIRATREGVLDNLPWRLGARVSAGATVAVILADQAPYARVYVPEKYRVRIHSGDTLTVLVDGVSEPFKGRVRWIAQEPAFTPYYALNAKDRARLVYLAEVQLPPSANKLASGVPAQVVMP